MANHPQTPFFSSTFASDGDQAMGEGPSSRRQQRSHSRSTNSLPNREYDGRSVSSPNPYNGKRDTRNTAAQMDPSWYAPSFCHPPALDVDNGLEDEDDMPSGGPIISPRHWDCMHLAQKSGISPLYAAALECRKYHGYQTGYYPLMVDIIFKCRYKDHTRTKVIGCYKDIVLLHRRVMDAWVNHRTQQSGPLVDQILDKGLPVFPKLESLAVDATVNFYDKLQKMLALFLLPLMVFDVIKLNTGFEGLCPPGLGLPQYAEIASVLMEIIPRLLPTWTHRCCLWCQWFGQNLTMDMTFFGMYLSSWSLVLIPRCRLAHQSGWAMIYSTSASRLSSTSTCW